MHLILLGAPGAGKGTQGALLAERLGVPKIATGDILRLAVRDGTRAGPGGEAFMDARRAGAGRRDPRAGPGGSRAADAAERRDLRRLSADRRPGGGLETILLPRRGATLDAVVAARGRRTTRSSSG